MIKSFASRIWVTVRFIAFCVVSQQFHPPMYFQTLKNYRVNEINWLKTKFLFCKGFSVNQPRMCQLLLTVCTLRSFHSPDVFRTS